MRSQKTLGVFPSLFTTDSVSGTRRLHACTKPCGTTSRGKVSSARRAPDLKRGRTSGRGADPVQNTRAKAHARKPLRKKGSRIRAAHACAAQPTTPRERPRRHGLRTRPRRRWECCSLFARACKGARWTATRQVQAAPVRQREGAACWRASRCPRVVTSDTRHASTRPSSTVRS